MQAVRKLTSLLVIIFGLILPPVSTQAAQTLKIGTVVWVGYGPFYVADALGFYKKHGLDVVLQNFTDPALIPSAMSGGAVDGGMLTYDQVINAAAQGLAFKVVMPIDYSNGGDAILGATKIGSVADLKGKKVGFNPLSPSDFLLSYALQKNGMSEKDIDAINMTPESIPAAMASGSISVGVTYEPNVSQILGVDGGKKFHVIFSSKDAPGLITDVLVFDAKFIRAHPDAVEALMRAYLDALAYMKSHPEKAAAIIGKAMGVSTAEAQGQLGGVYNIPLVEMPKNFAKTSDTTSFYASGSVISQLLQKKGQIKRVPSTADTLEDRFVRSLLKN